MRRKNFYLSILFPVTLVCSNVFADVDKNKNFEEQPVQESVQVDTTKPDCQPKESDKVSYQSAKEQKHAKNFKESLKETYTIGKAIAKEKASEYSKIAKNKVSEFSVKVKQFSDDVKNSGLKEKFKAKFFNKD